MAHTREMVNVRVDAAVMAEVEEMLKGDSYRARWPDDLAKLAPVDGRSSAYYSTGKVSPTRGSIANVALLFLAEHLRSKR